MQAAKLLVTGEFWHADFVDLINRVEIPTTLIPSERMAQLSLCDDQFSLILIAQSRRGSVQQSFLDHLQRLFPQTPVVVLLGSWCEGEMRSGQPLKNAFRMYWHEWNGSYVALAQRLCAQSISISGTLAESTLTGGTTRATSSHTDTTKPGEMLSTVGVSALTLDQFEMVEDGLRQLRVSAVWLEHATWQASQQEDLAAICLDCESLSEILERRIEFCRDINETAPLILMMNFPRKQEVLALRDQYEVAAVISKPFDLLRLHQTLHSVGVDVGELPNLPQIVTVPDVRTASNWVPSGQ